MCATAGVTAPILWRHGTSRGFGRKRRLRRRLPAVLNNMFRSQTVSVLAMLMMGVAACCAGSAIPAGMARIGSGVYRPSFRAASDVKEMPVKAFALDILPVTNGDFLEFVRANPRWQRSHVKRIFADDSYLKHWEGDLQPGTNAPV